ncbi:MAG TPA: hypothetical protein VN694_08590 [Caulobacteraceae bacterium]|nr:hypothetical protein [Caulobacteraceae bacterium]
MQFRWLRGPIALCCTAVALLALTAGPAAAVPAFAVQTGEPCSGCHVGGFGPQLTPFGRQFKLQGYTLRATSFNVPLSAMVIASYMRTAKPQDPPPAPGFGGNDNFALDQLSLFFAGGFGDHFGAFVQGTYDGVAKAWHWDNLDLRATTSVKAGKTDVTLGTSLNNAPSVQDAWNTLPAWGFPYTTSALAPTPSTSPLLGGLAQSTMGLTGYAWINSEVYLEAGGYVSPSASALTHLGVDPTDPGSISGVAPYARFAFQHDLGKGTAQVGAFGMQTGIFPGRDHTTGLADRYTDVGFDGSYYVKLANDDTLTFNGRYMHERQSLQASCALGGTPGSACTDNTLNDLRLDGSYYWRNTVGATLAYFDTTGSANPIVYAANRTLTPNSAGVTFQVDGTLFGRNGKSPLGPRFNTRIGAQYTAYTRFDGARGNFDSAGRNAGDNNIFRLFVWAAY